MADPFSFELVSPEKLLLSDDVEMVVVVNNKAEGSSPLSVLELARQIAQASLAAAPRSTSAS